MTLEQVLVLAILVLAPLINVLVRVLRGRPQSQAPREAEPGAANVPAPERRLPVARVTQRREPRGILPSAPSAPPSTRRRRARVRVGSARDARRAIVLIAVMGPCRGLEPPGLDRFLGERNA